MTYWTFAFQSIISLIVMISSYKQVSINFMLINFNVEIYFFFKLCLCLFCFVAYCKVFARNWYTFCVRLLVMLKILYFFVFVAYNHIEWFGVCIFTMVRLK